MEFTLHKIADDQHDGMIVATFEHPHDWLPRSRVCWNFQNVTFPVIVYAGASNPNGTESFEFLPIEPFFSVEPNYGFVPTQSYGGIVYMDPMSSLEAMLTWTIPKYRGNAQNLRLIDRQSLPELAQTLKAEELHNVPNEGVRVRIEYVESNQVFEEDFYACGYRLPTKDGQTNWGLTRLICFRAARGRLDSLGKAFWRIYTSLRINLEWQQLCTNVSSQLTMELARSQAAILSQNRALNQSHRPLIRFGQGQRESQRQEVETRAEAGEAEVSGTVYAPARAGPGDGFLVQVFLHLPEQAALLEAMAKEFDEDARKADYAKLKEKIKRGTELTLFLEMPGLEIEDPAQSCVWQGGLERVRFGVTVPKDFAPKDILAKVTVAENSIPVGHLRFKMKIGKTITAQGEADASSTQTQIPVGNLNRYKQAFISYASQDRQEVTKRVQMLNLVKIRFFQDLLTLEPGDPFEKLIYKYIDESDVFFLFWSTAASQSEWVLREVEYAIKRKSEKAENPPEIIPVIIEGPPPAKPPEELNFLHFNDRFMYFINTRETAAKPNSV